MFDSYYAAYDAAYFLFMPPFSLRHFRRFSSRLLLRCFALLLMLIFFLLLQC